MGFTFRSFSVLDSSLIFANSRLAKVAAVFAAIALSLGSTQEAHAQAYGLTSRQPIGAYLGGKMPAVNPGGGGTWGTANAFPNLTFQSPIKMVAQPGSNRLWVIGREGHVYSFDNDTNAATKTLALDLSAVTQGWGDCGMVGIAFHPEFGKAGSANRNYVYLYYNFSPAPVTGSEPSNVASFNRLSRFVIPDGATTIDRTSEYVLINQFDEHAWHNGGDMYFGPDGFLYLTNGDEGGANDQYNNGQKIDSGLFGGVLRLDVNRDATKSHAIRRQPQVGGTPPAGWPATYSQGYFIPNDNPWVDPSGTVLEEFWAIGLRSPHRMSFDSVSGKTFIGDIGQGTMEEVSVLSKGANLQWPYREGSTAGPKAQPSPLRGVDTPPLYAYNRNAGDTCVIGGIVYRGSIHAGEIGGRYIFGDHISGRIWSMIWDQGTPVLTQLTSVAGGNKWQGLSGFSTDQNSELYIMTLGLSGQILKLTRANTNPQAPATLSATGAFANLVTLSSATGIVPYDVNSPLWSDGAAKKRWIALPNDGSPYTAAETINFAATGPWGFPAGTVFIKHFELPIDARNPLLVKRLETRLLVSDSSGGVYGVTYKWRADNSDADLLPTNTTEDITVTDASGGTRTQQWYYPSRENCLTCHNVTAGYVLGPKTSQINGDYLYASTGVTDNQLRTWSQIGMFSNPPAATAIPSLLKMANVENTASTLEIRVRSYLDANCSQCHRPNGVRANWDGRFETPLAQQNIVNGLVNDSLGILGARVVVPGQTALSIAHIRLGALDATKMPPLAKNVVHTSAVNTVAQWINSLVGGSLPAPWSGRDIGGPLQTGTDAFANGVFTITGGGADIWGPTDQFHYTLQTLTGDGEIIARVASQSVSDNWAKAGVMFRETLDAGSRQAMLVLTPANGMAFQWRPTTSGEMQGAAAGSFSAPNNWVRIVRVGDTFTAYQSQNGTAWTQVGSPANITMAATIQIGLAVASHTSAQASTVTFDNVLVKTAALQLPAVTVSLPNGVNYTAPATIPLNASVTANGNTISKVQFLNSATVIGESASAPYTTTWSSVAAGSYALSARVVTAAGSQVTSAAISVAVVAAPTALPTGWAAGDLGSPALAGSAAYTGGIFTVKGGGADIWNASDSFQFTSQAFTGNGEIVARVTSQTATDVWAKAGVMFRESLTANSRHAMMVLTPSSGTAFQYRATAGGASTTVAGTSVAAPNNWVRLIRNGSLLAAYRSTDGLAWTQLGSANITMASAIRAGLAVTSHNVGQLSTATFDSVRITPSTLPSPWAGVDVGSPQLTDLEKFASAVYTIPGGGAGLTGTSDQFHLVSKTLTGNGEIIARVSSQVSTANAAFAGIIMRETSAANSRYVSMSISPGSGFVFQRRSTAGGSTTRATATANAAPNNWVRLVRSGNTFTAYRSANGTSWTLAGTVNISMTSSLQAGFAVSSADNTKIGSATFDNVRTTP